MGPKVKQRALVACITGVLMLWCLLAAAYWKCSMCRFGRHPTPAIRATNANKKVRNEAATTHKTEPELADMKGLSKYLRALERDRGKRVTGRVNTSTSSTPQPPRADQVCADYLATKRENVGNRQSSPSSHRGREVTVLVSTFDRFNQLPLLIHYYASSPVVSRVVVTWQNPLIKAPRTTMVGEVPVVFLQQTHDSMNNRFNPTMLIEDSSPVFIVDDDMKVHLQDLELLFNVWLRHPEFLVGFSPRWFSADAGGALRYEYTSEDPPLGSPPSTRPLEGYALMLTKAMIISSDYLFEFSCGTTSLHRVVHDMVDRHFNCEDIGMSIIASLTHTRRLDMGLAVLTSMHTNRGRKLERLASLSEAPVLYVEPRHKLGDFGKMDEAGLHQRAGHAQVRSECLVAFAAQYGRLANRTTLPLQRFMVSSVPASKVVTHLHLIPYAGKPARLHEDCMEIKGSKGSYFRKKLNNPCSWDVPIAAADFKSTWE